MSGSPFRRALLLLAVGLVLGVASAWTLSTTLDAPLRSSFWLMIPLTILFAFFSGPIENACRANELSAARSLKSLSAHLLGAVLTSGIWTLAAIGIGRLHGAMGGHVWGARAWRLIFVEGLILYALAAAIHYLIIELGRTADSERRVVEARATAHEAELRALRFQINPHFLFNSLNSISSLCGSDPLKAREMTNRLAAFFRSSLSMAGGDLVPLERELQTLRQYLEIEQIRFGERLLIEIECSESVREARVPALIVQPLAENAIKHGAANIVGPASISVSCSAGENGTGAITVANDVDPDSPTTGGTATGLENVRSRLAAVFGDRALLRTSTEPGTFIASIRFPLIYDERDGESRDRA